MGTIGIDQTFTSFYSIEFLVRLSMVCIFVRLTTADKISFNLELSAPVKELRTLIASHQQVEIGLITLVFKGKILKDESTLEGCGRDFDITVRYRNDRWKYCSHGRDEEESAGSVDERRNCTYI